MKPEMQIKQKKGESDKTNLYRVMIDLNKKEKSNSRSNNLKSRNTQNRTSMNT